jgi:hypothetical protein
VRPSLEQRYARTGRRGSCGVLGLVCLCAWAAAWGTAQAGESYLPAVGPPPLRFALPPVLSLPSVTLPPLEPLPAPHVESARTPTASATTNSAETVLPATASTTPGATAPGQVTPPPVAPAPGAKPEGLPEPTTLIVPVLLDPQMSSAPLWQTDGLAAPLVAPDLQTLMRYFVLRPDATNNNLGVSLFGPVPFIPPPPRPPSSSASFQLSPAAQP